MENSAIVVLSGGQDSATCLAFACERYSEIHTITFDYNQRHLREIQCATILSEKANAISHRLIPISSLQLMETKSALLNVDADINAAHPNDPNLPATFVPGRNMMFLSLACIHAYSLRSHTVYTGVCQTDYSGYPDCREEFVQAMAATASLAMDWPIDIITPLMHLDKMETVLLMQSLNKLDWYAHTHTCYRGSKVPCGECPACKLRAKGFQKAKIPDPLLEA
ncbi:MAG: 7-cyano-7-deazaguanine synthase QueC [Chloroflexi bacterium]|nr:MAG: 7-cyano-7-deazaguanine synthase QueC [Chloroflexota bacterium]